MERIIIAFPSTVTSNLRFRPIRAYALGQLARWLGLFRVTQIIVFYDPDPLFDSHGLGRYIVKVLKYCVTPPWFKKMVFPKPLYDKNFNYVPPLTIQSHQKAWIKNRSWGVLKKEKGKVVLIYRSNSKLVKKEIKDQKIKYPSLVPIEKRENKLYTLDPFDLTVENYIGYYPIYFNKQINKLIADLRKRFGNSLTVIGTSRKGKPINKVRNKLKRLLSRKNILILFGGPNRGLYEIEPSIKNKLDITVNAFPNQQLKTIHTLEAIPLCVLEMVYFFSFQ